MKVLYFARLAEDLGCREEVIETEASTAQALLDELAARGEPWRSALNTGKLLVAVNQTMTSLDTRISNTDEIAFFPPVTGG